jgi:uncharacterized membrane protein
MLAGIIATISTSAELLITKLLLRNGKSHSEKYVMLHFLWTIIIMLPLLFFFFFMDLEKMNLFYYSIFLVVLLSAAVYNILQFKCIRRIPIEHSQPIILTSWVFTIILGYMFFPEESNLKKVILALFACFAVIIAGFNKKSIASKKYEILLFICAFFIGVYNLSSKIMLEIMSPFALYFLRTLFLLPVFMIIFNFKKEDLTVSHLRISLISFTSILSQTTTFWAYTTIGLVATSLLMNLAPIITLWGARVFLKEKVKLKYIIATVVVVICIGLSFFV